MFLKLLRLFQEKPFFIHGLSPYGIQELISSTVKISSKMEKQVCLLVDILRYVVMNHHLSFSDKGIHFLGKDLVTLDETTFWNNLQAYRPNAESQLRILLTQLTHPEEAFALLNQFEQSVIQTYIEMEQS